MIFNGIISFIYKMFRFIDSFANYLTIYPHRQPTKFTYFSVYLFLISLLAFFTEFVFYPIIYLILSNPPIFILLFVFMSCYYLAEINRYYEEYYN